jgi:hypothetical protein
VVDGSPDRVELYVDGALLVRLVEPYTCGHRPQCSTGSGEQAWCGYIQFFTSSKFNHRALIRT